MSNQLGFLFDTNFDSIYYYYWARCNYFTSFSIIKKRGIKRKLSTPPLVHKIDNIRLCRPAQIVLLSSSKRVRKQLQSITMQSIRFSSSIFFWWTRIIIINYLYLLSSVCYIQIASIQHTFQSKTEANITLKCNK